MKLVFTYLFFTAVVSSTMADLEATIKERELYTECRENGVYVPLSRSCCRETSDIQFLMASSFASDPTSVSDTCDQVNFDDLMGNFGTYCRVEEEAHHNSHTLCTYDVQKHNPSCAVSQRDSCEAMGGYLFQADVLLECEDFNPIILVKNSLSCMGASCDDQDIQEYLWVAAASYHTGLGPCTITRVQGQTYDDFKRKETVDRAAIVAVLITAILVFGVGRTVVAATRRRRELQKAKEARLPPVKEELSPLKNAQTMPEDEAEDDDSDSVGEFA